MILVTIIFAIMAVSPFAYFYFRGLVYKDIVENHRINQ
jgi:hypothetical protein